MTYYGILNTAMRNGIVAVFDNFDDMCQVAKMIKNENLSEDWDYLEDMFVTDLRFVEIEGEYDYGVAGCPSILEREIEDEWSLGTLAIIADE